MENIQINDLYTPKLSLLSSMGISTIVFPVKEESRSFLLSRHAIESGQTQRTFSYHMAGFPGFGLIHVRSGSLQLTIYPSEESVTLTGECSFIFDACCLRKTILLTPAEYEILYFEGQSLPYYRERLFHGVFLLHGTDTPDLYPELNPLFRKEPLDPIMEHGLLTGFLTEMFYRMIPQQKNIPSYLLKMKDELEKHYYRKHSLKEFEEKYGINHYRICREFKNYFQTAPMQYLHRMRIQAAQNLLLETDMKIHAISYEVGYESTNHFIHHFQKNTGKTPAEYRKERMVP